VRVLLAEVAYDRLRLVAPRPTPNETAARVNLVRPRSSAGSGSACPSREFRYVHVAGVDGLVRTGTSGGAAIAASSEVFRIVKGLEPI